jgi:hypothetical protein
MRRGNNRQLSMERCAKYIPDSLVCVEVEVGIRLCTLAYYLCIFYCIDRDEI